MCQDNCKVYRSLIRLVMQVIIADSFVIQAFSVIGISRTEYFVASR